MVSDTLFPLFCDMLAEGANKAYQCRMLKMDEDDAFGLPLATRHADTIGAHTGSIRPDELFGVRM